MNHKQLRILGLHLDKCKNVSSLSGLSSLRWLAFSSCIISFSMHLNLNSTAAHFVSLSPGAFDVGYLLPLHNDTGSVSFGIWHWAQAGKNSCSWGTQCCLESGHSDANITIIIVCCRIIYSSNARSRFGDRSDLFIFFLKSVQCEVQTCSWLFFKVL